MAGEPDLLVKDSRRGPGARTAAVILVLAALVVGWRLHPSRTTASVTLRTRGYAAAASTPLHTVRVSGASGRRIARDVTLLQPGRIGCGAPGPADVELELKGAVFQLNGECSTLVRLPESSAEPVWLESTALRDDLAAVLGRLVEP